MVVALRVRKGVSTSHRFKHEYFLESLGSFDGRGDNADMESPSQASVVAIGRSINVES